MRAAVGEVLLPNGLCVEVLQSAHLDLCLGLPT
jgi:hypothetical protein